MSKSEHRQQIAAMLQQQRWAALATVDAAGLPAASMVAYALDREQGCLYLHLSGLAAHTRELLQQPAAALVIGECDMGCGDPQQLARLGLRGQCRCIARDVAGYAEARECYLRCLPDAEQLFGFADFILFRFVIQNARFVGGFGQAHSYRGEELRALLRECKEGNGE